MKAVKESNVKNAEKILEWFVGITDTDNMYSFLNGYDDRDGITILDMVYQINNPEMIRLFERHI